MSDAVQALINEWQGIAEGDKPSFFTAVRAQEQHTANLATIAELRLAIQIMINCCSFNCTEQSYCGGCEVGFRALAGGPKP